MLDPSGDCKITIINTLKDLEQKMDNTGEEIGNFSRERETIICK